MSISNFEATFSVQSDQTLEWKVTQICTKVAQTVAKAYFTK